MKRSIEELLEELILANSRSIIALSDLKVVYLEEIERQIKSQIKYRNEATKARK